MRRLSPQTVALLVFVAGMSLSALDVTIVNTAIPTLIREFDTDHSSIQWVATSYLIALAISVPASGWLGDRYGTKRIYLLALALFTAGSGLCGLANGLTEMVAFRTIQGIGGGMMVPVGIAMLWRAFPPEQRARAARIIVLPTTIAPAMGPIIGGLFVTEVSWRWAFFVNVPVGIATFVFGVFQMSEYRGEAQGRIDVVSFVLSGGGLALVLYAMSRGPDRGWGSSVVVGTAFAGVVALVVVTRRMGRVRDPLIRLTLLRDRLFRRINTVCIFSFASTQGMLFIIPAFLQEERGLTALGSGLTTFAQPIGVAAAAQFVTRLYPRVGPRRLMMFGLLANVVMWSTLLGVDADTNLWAIRVILFLNGMAVSMMIIPQTTAMFTTIAPTDMGHATAIYSAQRQTSAAVGVSVLATVLSSVGGENPGVGAYHIVFLAASGLALAGALFATRVPDEDAAPTMLAPAPVPAGRGRSPNERSEAATAH